MTPHGRLSISPASMVRSIFSNFNLIQRMTQREIFARYRGSMLGLVWSFLNPVLMLCVYTFVFTFVFKARWNIETTDNETSFTLILFVGLVLHAFFAEILTNASSTIHNHVNYVKKVVFPLEILTVVSLGVAAFQVCIGLVILLIILFVTNGALNWTVLLSVFTIFPLAILTLGVGWFFASLGVFLRDIQQFIGIAMTMALFLSPVLYPVSALPPILQKIMYFNPLTLPIEQTRNVIIFGKLPDWSQLGVYYILSFFICWLGFLFFQKTRNGFADVI